MNKLTGFLIGSALTAVMMSSAMAASSSPAPDMSAPVPQQATSTSSMPEHTTTSPVSTSATESAAKVVGGKATVAEKHAQMSRERVKEIQTALNEQGEKVATDGYMGPKTIHALKAYQHKHGLKVTGHPDEQTLKQLNIS